MSGRGLQLPVLVTAAAIQTRTQGAASRAGSGGGKPDVDPWSGFWGMEFFLYLLFCSAGNTGKHQKHHLRCVPPTLLQVTALSSACIRQKFCLTQVRDVQIQLRPPNLEKKNWKTHHLQGACIQRDETQSSGWLGQSWSIHPLDPGHVSLAWAELMALGRAQISLCCLFTAA